jgi:hypothetical protein
LTGLTIRLLNACVAVFDALPFKHIIAADSEFHFGGHTTLEDAGRSGERPRPVCFCAKDLRTGQKWEWRSGEFLGSTAPFPTGPDALFVAFYASAELGVFKACGWDPPTYVLDLFAEFRARTNGRPTPNGAGLLGALTYFGLDGIGLEEKRDLQLRILSGGPWSDAQWAEILAYCWSDVDALERLLTAMLPTINLPHALLRGRSMEASAAIEWNGVPVDVPSLVRLRQYWTNIQDDLIAAVDRDYGVFEGRTFKLERWERYLAANGIPWPRLESGRLDLSDDTFRQMARSHPAVSPMRELRSALSEMRLSDLAVGSDARNRTILSAFRARTGRNQPSNTKFIFGPSVWLRFLIKPPAGYVSPTLIGANRNLGSLLHCPAILRCGPPICRATATSRSQSKQAVSRPTPPRRRTDHSASDSSNACWRSSTAWKPKVSRAGLVSLPLLAGI